MTSAFLWRILSDTILMPLYGFSCYDEPAYSNYMRFSMSTHNPTYNPESKGIQWGDHAAATFTGYMSGMGLISDAESLSGEQGYLTEIRKLTDVDGSLWWWPYYNDAAYGDVVRHHNCGKCGWASGVFAGMFMSQVLGLSYDAPTANLTFRPYSPTSSFSWDRFSIGGHMFSVSYRKNSGGCIQAGLTNHSGHAITANFEIPLEAEETAEVLVNGLPAADSPQRGQWNGRQFLILHESLQPGETKSIEVL